MEKALARAEKQADALRLLCFGAGYDDVFDRLNGSLDDVRRLTSTPRRSPRG